jgi:hypothetical protein
VDGAQERQCAFRHFRAQACRTLLLKALRRTLCADMPHVRQLLISVLRGLARPSQGFGRRAHRLHIAGAKLKRLMFDGLAPLFGIAASAAAAWALSPAWALPGFACGALVCRVLVRQRRMTMEETALAVAVFGPAFPALRRIVMTDLAGVGGTCFVCPGLRGQILVNLGRRAFEHPIRCCTPTYQAPGKLLVHELAHAWQIAHGHYFPKLAKRIAAGPAAGDAFYRPPQALSWPWPDLNLEQQATLVDEWFAPGRLGPDGWAGSAGMSSVHPYADYVRTVIGRGP